MKKKGLLALTMIFLSPLVHSASLPAPDSFGQKAIFHNWLLSRCIGKINGEVLKEDAFKSAAAWLEQSRLPIDAFEQGNKLIDEGLTVNLSGSVASQYNTLKCTLISQSHEADDLFSRYYSKNNGK